MTKHKTWVPSELEKSRIERLARKGISRYQIAERTGRSPKTIIKILGFDPKGMTRSSRLARTRN